MNFKLHELEAFTYYDFLVEAGSHSQRLSWSDGLVGRLSRAAAGCTEGCENSELLWAIARASST